MATYVSVSRSCGFRASSAWLGPKAVARWLRDTCVNMTQDKVKLAKRAAEAYNRRVRMQTLQNDRKTAEGMGFTGRRD